MGVERRRNGTYAALNSAGANQVGLLLRQSLRVSADAAELPRQITTQVMRQITRQAASTRQVQSKRTSIVGLRLPFGHAHVPDTYMARGG